MKKIILVITAVLCSLHVQAKHFWRGELMSIKKACKKWGGAPLGRGA